jgi:hypothetical protein
VGLIVTGDLMGNWTHLVDKMQKTGLERDDTIVLGGIGFQERADAFVNRGITNIKLIPGITDFYPYSVKPYWLCNQNPINPDVFNVKGNFYFHSFDFGGVKGLAFGGGVTKNSYKFTRYVNYFPEESPTLIQKYEILNTLEGLAAHKRSIEYIFSYECPSSCLTMFPARKSTNSQQDFLQQVYEIIQPRLWVFSALDYKARKTSEINNNVTEFFSLQSHQILTL